MRSWKAHEGGVHAVAFAPDGSGLATAGADAEVRLWRAGRDDDATPVRRFVTAGPAAHAVAFSDDGVWLTAGDPVGVRVWATATGRLLSVDYTGPVSGIAFAPDERAAVTTGPHRQVVAFAQRDGAPAATVVVRGETSATAQAISPDGGTTAVIGTEEIVTEPDAPAPKPPQDDESEDPPPDGEFSRAVLQLAGLSDGRVRHTVVLDVEKPSATRFLVRFTPDGNRVRIVTSGGRVFTYDTVTGAPVGRAVTLYTPGSDESAPAFTLAADPRGRYAVAYGPVTVFVDLATGRAETLSLEAASSVESLESVESVAVGPDGATLALGTREGMVLRFDRATGAARTPLRLTSGGSIEALAFHPEQDVLAVASSGRTVLWSLGEEPRPSVTLRGAAGQDVAALRFNHSGDTLAVASRNAVTLHRATTGSKITELHAWGDGVRTVEFSPGGGALHAVVEGELPPLRWDVLPSDQPVKRLCERAGRPLSRVEWDETPVGEDVEYRPVCTAS
ncbi:WD40 repeat domain-containing protein [Streptomyces sp. JJ38]|nr:WD40 repeat domain-containing protein [Streptomyces sp. JJ38]